MTVKYDGIKVAETYESPFVTREGRRDYIGTLKHEFANWIAKHEESKYSLSPSELTFLKDRVQESTRLTKSEKRQIDKRSATAIVSIMILVGVFLYYTMKDISIGSILSEPLLGYTLITIIGLVVFIIVPSMLIPSGEKRRLNEMNAIKNAIQGGHYTVYRFPIMQKKWNVHRHSSKSISFGHKTQTHDFTDFYVEFDGCTFEVDIWEYEKMKKGGNAVVVMIHTTKSDIMSIFAPRG